MSENNVRYSYHTNDNIVKIIKDVNHEIVLPEIEITQEQFLEMSDNILEGKKYKLFDGSLVLDDLHTLEHTKNKVIHERNCLLMASDWTMLPDVALSEEKKNEWKIYRQQLRDITDDVNFPNVQLPTAPTR